MASDNNVIFYLDGSTIEDKSPMKHAITTNNNLIPNSIEQGKFDGAYCEGGCAYNNTDNVFSFGKTPFTIDFWVNKPNEGNYGDFLFSYDTSNPMVNGYGIGYMAGKIVFKQWSAINSYSSLYIPINAGEWYHIAFVGDGANVYAYCNGVFQSKVQQKELKSNALAFKPQGYYYIDEFRISNIARWNTDFVPPKTPLGYSPIINATILEKNVTITIEDKYECIDKVEVFVNNVLSKTYIENFDTLTYAIDESLLGIGLNNIKVVVVYDGTDKIEKVIDYNVNINTLSSNSSLNKIVEVVELLSNTNQIEYNNLKNNLIEKGVECSDNDKMSSLIDKIGDIGASISIQRGIVDIPANSVKKTVNISKVDRNKSVCLCRRNAANSVYTAYAKAICKLESDTQISLNTLRSPTYNNSFYWEVIEFKGGVNKVHNISLGGLNSNTTSIKTHTHNLNLKNPNKCLVYWTCNTTAQTTTPEAVEVFNLTSNTINVAYEGAYIDNLYISIVEFD